jgi:uncharacterized membrane protein HdeD (DUF308 family)
MVDILLSLLSGIYLIYMGIKIINTGAFVMRGVFLDFSNWKNIAGFIFIALGITFIYFSLAIYKRKFINK